MLAWKNTIQQMQTQKQITLELINYQYGYIAWCIGNRNYTEARKLLDEANKNLEIFFSKRKKTADYYSYKAAFIGFEIGLDKYKAPFLGPKSNENLKKAILSDPENYFAYAQKAHADFYTPSIFGGSKTNAIEYYKKALLLYEKNIRKQKDWNYLALLTDIIRAYMEIEKYNEAKIFADKTLNIEPNYKWVRDELYPKIIKNLKNE
jgi:tetratricopeptide (TPR) repeat protein